MNRLSNDSNSRQATPSASQGEQKNTSSLLEVALRQVNHPTDRKILETAIKFGAVDRNKLGEACHLTSGAVGKRADKLARLGLLKTSIRPDTVNKVKPTFIYSPHNGLSLELLNQNESIQSSYFEEEPASDNKEPASLGKSQLANVGTRLKPSKASREEILLSKLPDYDPEWSEEMQMKWLESYSAIVTMFKG